MDWSRVNRRDAIAGASFVVIGLFFIWQAQGLEIGTARRMGPAYFPLIAAAVLILLGVVVFIGALRSGVGEIGDLAWRGAALILPAPILFGLTVRGAGLVPALFLATLIAAFASRRMGVLQALALALAVTAFCTAVFSYGLGLPIPRFGTWFDSAPVAVAPAPAG